MNTMNEKQKKMIEQLYACAKQCNALCNETDNEPVQILSVRYDFFNQDTTVQVYSGIELISEVLNGQQLMECSDAESGRKWRELRCDGVVFVQIDDVGDLK